MRRSFRSERFNLLCPHTLLSKQTMRTGKQSYQGKNIGKTKDMQNMRTKHMV
jgi:hypothetical protein